MKQHAALGLVVLVALSALAGIGLLAFNRQAQRAAALSASPSPTVAVAPRPTLTPGSGSSASPAPTPTRAPTSAPPSAVDDLPAFQARVRRLAQGGTKQDYRSLLQGWRTGALPRERERLLDDLLTKAQQDPTTAVELDKAVGTLFLEEVRVPARRRALASLLATSGSDAALGYLLAGAAKPAARPDALGAIKTISAPGVLPGFQQAIKTGAADPELLDAIRAALRNIDTPKARDIEQALPR